jgi:hypothetical protein
MIPRFYVSAICDEQCHCLEIPTYRLNNCVWGALQAGGMVACVDRAKMSHKELEQGMNNTTSRPPNTTTSTAPEEDASTSTDLETRTLQPRKKHNWAFICATNDKPDRELYYHCTSSMVGFFCDSDGNVCSLH